MAGHLSQMFTTSPHKEKRLPCGSLPTPGESHHSILQERAYVRSRSVLCAISVKTRQKMAGCGTGSVRGAMPSCAAWANADCRRRAGKAAVRQVAYLANTNTNLCESLERRGNTFILTGLVVGIRTDYEGLRLDDARVYTVRIVPVDKGI